MTKGLEQANPWQVGLRPAPRYLAPSLEIPMLRLPLARRALMAATACSLVSLPVLLLPSAARADTPNESACSGLYHGSPPGSLAMTTNPPSGTVLHPGDAVEVAATWDTADWPTPVLHKVLDCLVVDGEVDYGLSTQEKPTDNDGLYRYSFTVPGRAAGGRICDRVRLRAGWWKAATSPCRRATPSASRSPGSAARKPR